MDWSQLHWAHWPDLAWLLPLVVVCVGGGHVAYLVWKARVRRLLGHGRHARRLVASASPARGVVKAVLGTIGSALVVVALLRPQYGMREVEVAHSGIDIAIALDASKSMLVQDVAPNRLRGAVLEIGALLDRLGGGRVALVPFAGLPFVQSPLTSDFEVIRLYLRDLRVQDMPVGGTGIGRALAECLRVLTGARPERPAGEADDAAARPPRPDVRSPAGSKYKAIVLLTDGEENIADPESLVAAARDAGVRIFTVGVGTRAGKPIPILQEDGTVTGVMKEKDGITPRFSALNEPLLTRLADETGGAYFPYAGRSIVPDLAARIEQLEKREFESSLQSMGEDRFQFALVPGLLLLGLDLLLTDRRSRRREEAA